MKLMRKLLCVVLMAALLAAVAVPALAEVEVPESVTIYKASSDNSHTHLGNINIWGVTPSMKITKPKSSKTSVLKVSGLNRWSSSTTWYDGDEDSDDADISIYINPIKAGKANVSFKIAGVAYKVAVTVKKYVNPFKKFIITGISGENMKSKFAQSAWVTDEMTSNAKKGSIKIATISGWKIYGISWRNENTGLEYSQWLPTPKSSITFPIPAMKTTENYDITLSLENTTTGGDLYVDYSIFNVAGE